jgi:hypothetical protein
LNNIKELVPAWLRQFFGIEIDYFELQIVKLSLWLAEHQMNIKLHEAPGHSRAVPQLKDTSYIVHGNIL